MGVLLKKDKSRCNESFFNGYRADLFPSCFEKSYEVDILEEECVYSFDTPVLSINTELINSYTRLADHVHREIRSVSFSYTPFYDKLEEFIKVDLKIYNYKIKLKKSNSRVILSSDDNNPYLLSINSSDFKWYNFTHDCGEGVSDHKNNLIMPEEVIDYLGDVFTVYFMQVPRFMMPFPTPLDKYQYGFCTKVHDKRVDSILDRFLSSTNQNSWFLKDLLKKVYCHSEGRKAAKKRKSEKILDL